MNYGNCFAYLCSSAYPNGSAVGSRTWSRRARGLSDSSLRYLSWSSNCSDCEYPLVFLSRSGQSFVRNIRGCRAGRRSSKWCSQSSAALTPAACHPLVLQPSRWPALIQSFDSHFFCFCLITICFGFAFARYSFVFWLLLLCQLGARSSHLSVHCLKMRFRTLIWPSNDLD